MPGAYKGNSIRLVGLDKITARLHTFTHNFATATPKTLEQAADIVMAASQPMVPVVSGELKRKVYQRHYRPSSTRYAVEFGYFAKHAPFIHENPNAGRVGNKNPVTGKQRYSYVGEWKFFEKALDQTAPLVIALFVKNHKVNRTP